LRRKISLLKDRVFAGRVKSGKKISLLVLRKRISALGLSPADIDEAITCARNK